MDGVAVLVVQAGAHIAVQVLVERLDLIPQLVDLGREGVGVHIVAGPPQGAGVLVAELARAFVGQGGQPLVVCAHRRGHRAPALPHRLQLGGVAGLGEDVLHVVQRQGLALIDELAGGVGGIQLALDPGHLVRRARPARRRQGDVAFEQFELAADDRIHRRRVEKGGAHPIADLDVGQFGVGLGLQPHGVVGDLGGPHPGGAVGVFVGLGQVGLGPGHKVSGLGSGGWRVRGGGRLGGGSG